MDLSQLHLFKDIVQTRSISRGAALNGVTQSAASQAVQELERALGVQLLDRSRRPLEVLPAGRLLYEFGRDVLRRQQEFLVGLEELRGALGGTVRVAAIYSVGISEMSRLEAEFARRMPDAALEVNYLRPEKVYQAVADERADLGLVSYPESTREVIALPWREEPMVIACAPQHPLAGCATLRPEDLASADFIGFDDYHRPDAILLIEWPSRAASRLSPAVVVELAVTGPARRRATVRLLAPEVRARATEFALLLNSINDLAQKLS